MPRTLSKTFSRASLTAAIVICACISACTPNRGGRNVRPVKAVAVEIQNNLSLPTALTIYATNGYAGRVLLGNAASAGTTTLAFTPAAYSETYRLVATRPLGRNIVSQPFTVGSEMTGRIVWTLVPNIIGFLDVDETDTVTTPK